MGGFGEIFEFVAMSVLGLLIGPSNLLKMFECTFAYIVIEHRINPSYVYYFPGLAGNVHGILINDFKM